MAEVVNQRANAQARVVLSPDEGEMVWLRKLGIRFMVGGEETQGNFALVEHPIGPRALAAPMHTHRYEDEYTYVLEGEVGVQVGEEVLAARPGDLVFKPRGVPHAFWNAADEPARALEIISPAGFERYFAELAPLFPPANRGPLDEEAVGAVREKYGLEMDMGSIPVLAERHGLLVDVPPSGKEQAMVQQHAADTLQPFLDQLREALTAVANGDPEPMKALCSHSDDVSQCGFWGGVESGWAEVGERWDWVAAQFVPGPGVVTSDTALLTVSGDMAYGVFIERWWGQFTSLSEPSELMIRATLIFRREDGVWKAVHRHGDNAVAKAPPS